MKHLWIPNVFVYNLVSFKALDCLQKLAGLWIVKDRDILYNQVGFGFDRICDIFRNQNLLIINKMLGKILKFFPAYCYHSNKSSMPPCLSLSHFYVFYETVYLNLLATVMMPSVTAWRLLRWEIDNSFCIVSIFN